MENNKITVTTLVNIPAEAVWKKWTTPDDIVHWNNASADWYTPKAVNNLTVGGGFNFSMAAKDGSFAFDFIGTYTNIIPNERIEYSMEDGRKVTISFEKNGENTLVTESFDPETTNPLEMQRKGWQAILDNFKKYAESTSGNLEGKEPFVPAY